MVSSVAIMTCSSLFVNLNLCGIVLRTRNNLGNHIHAVFSSDTMSEGLRGAWGNG